MDNMDNNYDYQDNSAQLSQMKRKQRNIILLLVIFIAVLTIGSFASFIVPMFMMNQFMNQAVSNENSVCNVSVSATVIDNEKKTTITQRTPRRRVSGYAPVYSYEYNGKTYVIHSGSTHDPATYEIGETAEIFIDPNDPEHIYDPKNTNTDGFFSGVFLFGGIFVGAVVLIIVVTSLILAGKRKKKKPLRKNIINRRNPEWENV